MMQPVPPRSAADIRYSQWKRDPSLSHPPLIHVCDRPKAGREGEEGGIGEGGEGRKDKGTKAASTNTSHGQVFDGDRASLLDRPTVNGKNQEHLLLKRGSVVHW
eukprot:4932279-Pyramimonas_sp.AAC.1